MEVGGRLLGPDLEATVPDGGPTGQAPEQPVYRAVGLDREAGPDGRLTVHRAPQLIGGALGDGPAGGDDQDPVGQRLDLVHVVAGQHDRGAQGSQAVDHLPGLAPGRRIEPGGRLVQEQKVRVADDAECQVDPALLAPRQPVGASVAEPVEADQFQHLVDGAAARVAGPVVLEGLAHGQLPLDAHLLEDDPDPVPEPRRSHRRIVAQHLHGAGVSAAVSLEDLHGRRLAGPVRPQQREHLTGLHVERQVVDGPDVAVGLPQTGHGEGGRRRHGGEASHHSQWGTLPGADDLSDSAAMRTVSFEHMVDGTPEDYDLIGRELAVHKADNLAGHVLGTLEAMAGPLLGYPVDRFQHSLQSATRALRNGEDDEMVVAALLHDVGDPIAPENHSAVAADILRPYVSDRTHWIIRHHGLFQGYYYFHHLGADRDARDALREHQWFDDCAAFCEEYDQNCFERNHDTLTLEEFEPMVRDLFARPSRFPLPQTTLV